jgi:hypothetical protein
VLEDKGVVLEDDGFCGPSCVFAKVGNLLASVSRKVKFKLSFVRRLREDRGQSEHPRVCIEGRRPWPRVEEPHRERLTTYLPWR